MDFEKIKDFILEKKGLVIGIIATILIGGYFIQKNNQPAINNSQVLSENNKNQSTDFSKNKSLFYAKCPKYLKIDKILYISI